MEQRVLILAPRGRDAQVIRHVLKASQRDCWVCAHLGDLAAELERGAGAAVVTEEALLEADLRAVQEWLQRQPPWSDFPFVMLASKQVTKRSQAAQSVVSDLSNLVVLERPISSKTLTSAIDSALRARNRQYQTRRHLREREQAEERLRLALDAGRLGAWELDVDSCRLDASRTCKINFGRHPAAEFSYEQFLASVHVEDCNRHREAMYEAMTGNGNLDIEYRNVWPDGSTHWVQLRGQRSYGESGEPRIIGVTLDVTDRRSAEAQLLRSQQALAQLNETLELRILERTRDLARANDRLVKEIAERERAQAALVQAQKMEAVGQLTNGIAHDFNNLLTAIVGNVDMIGRRTADERTKRLASYALEAAQRATRLTGQLLAFSRTQRLDLRPVDVGSLIDGMSDLMQRSIGPAVEIVIDLQAGKLLAVADANQLELAVLNLIINARDAMSHGGLLTISTSVRETDGHDLQAGSYVVLSIADTGTGIAPDLLEKVFEPFFTTKPTGKGTGLGLSQVYGITQQSGGTVRLSSALGQGTTVELWLPVSHEHGTSKRCFDPDDLMVNVAHDESVLVVEDDRDVRRFVVECLRSLGYRVSEADNGYGGLEMLQRQGSDVLIVDFAMPGIDGAEFAHAVRQSDPDVPIIFVTGYADMNAIERIGGPTYLLRKPFEVSQLGAVVRDALKSRTQSAARASILDTPVVTTGPMR